jgi:hypothetical protein
MSGSPVPTQAWPAAELGPLRRIRVLAAATRHATYAERRFEVGPDRLWAVVADLENELPYLIPGVRAFTALDRGADRGRDDGHVNDGGTEEGAGAAEERFHAVAVGALGYRERFSVLLRPGWCLMQSRVLIAAMAAEAEGDGTGFAFLAALRVPGGGALHALRRIGAQARNEASFERLDRRIAARFPSPAPGASPPGASPPGAPEGDPRPEEP